MNLDYNQKTEKYIIINMCGVNYKAKHSNSSSINNQFLLFLAQIKYFIKVYTKTIFHYAFKIINPILHHVLSNYEELTLLLCSSYIMIGGFYLIIFIIADILNISNKSPHSMRHPPDSTMSSIILNHIVVYSFYIMTAIISTILAIYCLSHIYMVIKQLLIMTNHIIHFIVNKLMKYYSKIPEVEPIDPLDIV